MFLKGRTTEKVLPYLKNKMSEKLKIIALLTGFLCLTALAFLGLGAMIGYQRGVSDCRVQTVTDTIVERDTIMVDRIFTDTIVKTQIVPYTFTVHDTVDRVDSVVVDLPIESHHTYIEDTADIWYSGFAAMLDSVKIYNHTTTITKTEVIKEAAYRNTIAAIGGIDEVSLMYARDVGRLHVGLSAGYGFDKTPKARCVVGFRF